MRSCSFLRSSLPTMIPSWATRNCEYPSSSSAILSMLRVITCFSVRKAMSTHLTATVQSFIHKWQALWCRFQSALSSHSLMMVSRRPRGPIPTSKSQRGVRSKRCAAKGEPPSRGVAESFTATLRKISTTTGPKRVFNERIALLSTTWADF